MSGQDAISLWNASAVEDDFHAPLDVQGVLDVVIIGGGFTGLSSALHCANEGLSAHVLEAEQIGYGGSGRNCGLVNAALWLPPQKVREKLGESCGPRFLEMFCRGPEYVFSLIEKHQIRCEVTRTGTIHGAHAPSGFRDLQDRHKEWQRLGEPVDLLSREQVSEMVGTTVFHGGLLDHRAGTINPMGYVRGLARATLSAGARISTKVRATKLSKDGDLWIVETDKGAVKAKAVVLGTNAYTDDLWPGLKKNFTLINYFQFATKPLGPEAAHIMPGKQGLWDTGQIMFNLRRDAYDRLLIGSMGKVLGDINQGISQRWARKQIARLFPTLGYVEFEAAWTGRIAMTPDHLPRIHELEKNLFTTIGYNGRGITTGTLFGRTMSQLLTGMDRADLPLPMTETSTVKSAPIVSRLYQTAFTAKQILKAI
ncbi:FAD-binding oxidoreductase [Shimia sp.]|uniref:NAD(P)/FAD-dependent oxidoreductase n=1 Tax=Shimia sp. TaxID=1954381 RepID=UPI003299025B